MKLFKSIIYICLITISLCSVAMIYGETRQSQWIDKFIDSFELTNSNFKFYNIKANMMIEKDIDMNELQNICLLIAQNLTNNKDEVCLKTEKSQVYVNYNDKNTGISIVGIKKNAKESYIIVDILNELSEYSNDVDINVCIAGEYTKKLKKAKISDILQKILYNMYAEKISDIEEENFLSVNAYSKLLKENNLKYLDREINLNIGIRYSEDDDKTMIYIATPIIKIDY